ncbi:PREDICTED: sorting nexin-2-like [Priapulus caudatus]|uniref:Sorting nexin-2-like n=2 Tax=Priapulus caudatus TaxID=37621 RepID=A0ABM1EVE1_PRICU|nr:PREDICTED: sorting nexin-2-like [Priapulus caudatus]
MSKDDDSKLAHDEFVEKRRASLERYLNRTASNPTLQVDADFREFLELDADLPKATGTSALSGAGVMRLFNRVGESVNKMTYKMDEADEWFEEKQQQLENLDNQLRKLHASVEALLHHRKQLSVQTASFAKSAAMLGSAEEHTCLSRALSQLAEVEEKIEQLHDKQGDADFFLFAELLKDYVNLVGAVKEVFHQRVKVFQNWEAAQLTLNKKREMEAKMQLGGKTEKLDQVKADIAEWETNVQKSHQEFETISKTIKKEVERFEQQRVSDFKSTIIKYLESLMDDQQQLIKYWEAFLPEAKAIA